MTPDIRIYHSLAEVPAAFAPSALTIGNFDGVHRGHRAIAARVAAVAGEHGWNPSVLTFNPHPTRVIVSSRAPKLMTRPEERCRLLAEAGIRQALILPFTHDVAKLSPEEFVRTILVEKLGAKAVLVGDNFRFGHKQSGDVAALAEFGRRYGFLVEVVPAVTRNGETVSSSAIRAAVESGRMARARQMLGRPFALSGSVIRGYGVGSKQTVPTLNLAPDSEVLPANGVYVTRTTDLASGRVWPSVSNIGVRPTFDGHALSIETFLLAPLDIETPGRIRVEFFRRLREERKFESAEALKTQILRDAARAQAFHRRLGTCAAAPGPRP
jgi:riboflavin kinase / FMN adenylyltransferase